MEIEAFVGSNNHQLSEPSLQAQTPPPHDSPGITDPELRHDILHLGAVAPVKVSYDSSKQRHESKGTNSLLIACQKILDDGYHWRKYGQKQIKGSACPRSYYRCTHNNCPSKKQLERAQDGQIAGISYKGEHNHPKPSSSSESARTTTISIPTTSLSIPTTSNKSVEEEKINWFSVPSTKDNVTKNDIQLSHHVESTDTCGLPSAVARDNNVEKVALQVYETLDELHCDDAPKSNDKFLDNGTITTNTSPRSTALVEFKPSQLGENEDLCTEYQQTQSSHSGATPSISGDRLWGDGYNWRKYGQKQIKGSQFPRSYYRCTHVDCTAKKQLERTHDGLVTEISYKGKHDHPKPQPNSHMAVARLVSIQEDISSTFGSLSNNQDMLFHDKPNGNPKVSQIPASGGNMEKYAQLKQNHDGAEGGIGSGLGFTLKRCNKVPLGLNNQLSDQVESQCPSQSNVSIPSSENEKTPTAHDLTVTKIVPDLLTITVADPPVYMVTSKGIVPIELNSSETQNTTRPLMALEKLLENAYHWRKYGQKNIKGSEFPRSYYRCTHPNCKVKMQLVRSKDARITEIVYKGVHDHPKPQPSTRMAVGAILSFQEEVPGSALSCNDRENNSTSGRDTSSVEQDTLGDLSIGSASGVESAAQSSKKVPYDIEESPDAKRKKIDTGNVDLTSVGKANNEQPRKFVVKNCETDVVDDGYRWFKYGRKSVKGNPYPRNYYKCSSPSCLVKKHVERSSENCELLVTTYEGYHNHDKPYGKFTGHDLTLPIICDARALEIRSGENGTTGMESGVRTTIKQF